MVLETHESNGEMVDQKTIDKKSKGRNYKSLISKDYIDNEGIRKVILATRNDRDQIIAELEIRPSQLMKENFYDGKQEGELENDSQRLSKDNSQYALRPTFIGNEYYKHIIKETTGENG